jgi:hypothetical protein
MRRALILLIGLLVVPAAWAEPAKDAKPAAPFGIEADPAAYPQATAKDALASVLKVIDNKRIDYLLAQLADPKFVDERVKVYDGNFDTLVKETTEHLANDPTLLRDLKKFAKQGEWDVAETAASVFLKDNKDKRAYFRKIGSRWYLENRQKEKAKPRNDKSNN